MRRLSDTKVNCEICNKAVYPRGLKSHLRLQHKLKVTEVTQVVESSTQVVEDKSTQVKETLAVTRNYQEISQKVSCCRCGDLVFVDMAEATRTRMFGCIACEKCITGWYSVKNRHESFLFGRYDAKGNTIFSRVRLGLLK